MSINGWPFVCPNCGCGLVPNFYGFPVCPECRKK